MYHTLTGVVSRIRRAPKGFAVFGIVAVMVLGGLFVAPPWVEAASITSTATGGNWSATSTWVGGVVPGAGDAVTIASGATVTMDVASTPVLLSVTVNPMTSSGSHILVVGANTLNTGSLTIDGASSNGRDSIVSVSTGTINVTNALAFTGTAGQAQLTFTGSGTLNIGGSFGTGGTFNGGTGIVNYSSMGNQTIGAYTYNNLTLSGGGIKTPTAGFTVNTDITIDSGVIFDVAGSGISFASATANVNGILDFTDSNGQFQNTTGTSVLSLGSNGLIKTVDTIGLGPVNNASLEGTWTTTSINTNGSVEYNRTSAQTITARTYNNLIFSGSGAKTIPTGTSVAGNLSIAPTGTATASVATSQTLSVNSLTLGGLGRINGTWGSTTATTATYKDNTYFAATTGKLTVATDTRATPTITTLPTATGITYSQALSVSTLSGGVGSVPGSFAFTAPVTVPSSAGTYSASVTFTPTDTTSYTSVTGSVDVAVGTKTVTVSVTAKNKTYDSTNVAEIDTCTVNDTVGADVVTCSAGGAMFAGVNVGTGTTVNASGITLGGANASNYQLSPDAVSTSANITTKPITVTANASQTKVYSESDPTLTYTADVLAGSDVYSGALSRVAGEDVGTYAITQGALSAGSNYIITFVSDNFNITARALTVTAQTNTKVYDTNTSTSATPLVTSGAVQGSDMANFIETYDTAEVGTGKTLTPSGTVTDGNSGNNYTYTFIADTTGVIQSAPLLKIIKVVTNDNGGTKVAADFSFTVNGGDAIAFEGDGENDVTALAGAYTIAEPATTGYTQQLSEDCTGTIANGEIKTCTITNNDITPSLTIIKHVVNNNGGTAVASDWTMNVTGTNASQTSFAGSEEGSTITLNAGTYSIDESGGIAGYAKTLGDNCLGTLALGDEKTCTITNDDIPPTLTVIKTTTGGDETFNFTVTGPDASTAHTSITTSGGSGHVGSTEMIGLNLTAGHYTVSESAKTGWDLNSTSCSKELTAGMVDTSAGSAGFTAGIGESWTCTFTNTKRGSITAHKTVVTPDGETAVDDNHAFTIRRDGSETGNTVSEETPMAYENLVPGTYTISEDADANYNFVSFSSDGNTDLAGAQITVVAGQKTDLTITNAQKKGHLLVKKVVTNPNGGIATAGQFSFHMTKEDRSPTVEEDGSISFIENETNPLLGENELSVDPGTYSITEVIPEGAYAISYSNCKVTVASNGVVGESTTCTITNSDIPESKGAITVVKNVVNDNGGTLTAGDFTLTLTHMVADQLSPASASIVSGQANFLDPGEYTINENDPSGAHYTKVSTVCKSGEVTTTDGTVTLDAQKAWTCTITNTDAPPSLTLVKQVTNNDGGTAVSGDFTLKATGSDEVVALSGVGPSVSSSATFKAGTYTLSESVLTGYTAGSWSCVKNAGDSVIGSSISLAIGDTATCTITNDDQPAVLTLIKKTDSASGNGSFDFTVVSAGETTPFSEVFSLTTQELTRTSEGLNLKKGSYDVKETAQEGWNLADVNCVYDDESVGTVIAGGKRILVGNGDHVTCTFTNTKQGTLIIKKTIVSGNGHVAHANDFSFKVDNGVAVAFEEDGQNNLVVTPGVHSVVEVTADGYTTTYENCANVDVPTGGTATCTVTNTPITTVIVTGDQTTTPTGNATVTIPTATTITGPADWNGVVTPPTVTTTFKAPDHDSGFDSATPVTALEMGAGDTPLTFDKPVKIVFAGDASKYVGWSRGGVFTKITAPCDSATEPILIAGADCRTTVNNDLIVWTRHFTVFVTYTQTATPAPVSAPAAVILFPSTPSAPVASAPSVPIPFPSSSNPAPRVLGEEATNVPEVEKALTTKIDATLTTRLLGRILLQVESYGYAWYVNPFDRARYYLGRPADAFDLMRQLGIGISNADLKRIFADKAFAKKHAGKIFIQVQGHGEAWYINPVDNKAYYLGRPADAFILMRKLGLGIKNTDIRTIAVGILK